MALIYMCVCVWGVHAGVHTAGVYMCEGACVCLHVCVFESLNDSSMLENYDLHTFSCISVIVLFIIHLFSFFLQNLHMF